MKELPASLKKSTYRILPREKSIFGGPFTHDNGSCLGMTWVRSLAVFVPEPTISTLENSVSDVFTVIVVKGNQNMLGNLATESRHLGRRERPEESMTTPGDEMKGHVSLEIGLTFGVSASHRTFRLRH